MPRQSAVPRKPRSMDGDTCGQAGPLSLDPLIHERMRLGIISALAVNECLSFNHLKRLLNTSDGNLSVHARKLEEAQYITCSKFFDHRMPKTEYHITPLGRRALEQYLCCMENLIRSMRPDRIPEA